MKTPEKRKKLSTIKTSENWNTSLRAKHFEAMVIKWKPLKRGNFCHKDALENEIYKKNTLGCNSYDF